MRDDGGGASPREGAQAAGPGGYGLIGMRERVALHGGTLTVGPRADGGFAVTADLPLDRDTDTDGTAQTAGPAVHHEGARR